MTSIPGSKELGIFLRSVVSKVALFATPRPQNRDARKNMRQCSLKPIDR